LNIDYRLLAIIIGSLTMRSLLIIALLALLAGCGSKGPLELPKDEPEPAGS